MHCTYYLARVSLIGKDGEVACCLRSDILDWTQLDRSFFAIRDPVLSEL